jgi:hypothetical protein
MILMKNLARLLVFLAAIGCLPARLSAQPAPVPAPPAKKFIIFILAGQSNMAGRGGLDPSDKIADPRILAFEAPGRWIPATEPLHKDKPVAGVGPGLAFARELLRHLPPDISIGLIPAAFGGTSIEKWGKNYNGNFRWPDGRTLFQLATESALAASKDGTLAGILWNQGEADAVSAQKDKGASYRKRLDRLIADFRSTLGQPDLPFVAATLGPWKRAQTPALNQVYLELPARVPCTEVIDTLAPEFENKLRNKPKDPPHYNAPSARLLGRAYAKAMLRIFSRFTSAPAKPAPARNAAALLPTAPAQTGAGAEPRPVAPADAGAGIELKPGVPVLVAGEPSAPEQIAIKHLLRDLEKVLGRPSRVITEGAKAAGAPAIMILAGGKQDGGVARDARLSEPEAHGMRLVRTADGPRLVLEGGDMRGVLYAIYSFTEECLGVPPLWYWSNWQPRKKTGVPLAGGFERIHAAPYVRWRAWFNNDHDFLTPWKRGDAEKTDAMFETILRLKYNTFEAEALVDVSSSAPPGAPNADAREAHRHGLVITTHHHSPLGSRIGRKKAGWNQFWKKKGRGTDIPKLSVNNVDALDECWRYHVDTAWRAGFECIWTVTFRGGGDIPFWQTFADSPKSADARGRVISAMLARQIAIVKEVTGDPAPLMRTTLYNENSDLFAAGLLRPPPEPSLIWNFVAARRDHFPAADVRGFKAPPGLLIGYYLNFQFTSTGSHLVAAEGPWKMAANYRVLDSLNSRPLAFTVVNAGNIREHVTELSANAAMMWRFTGFDAGAFLEKFSACYFDTALAPEIARLYRDYYNAYWCQKKNDIPGFDRQYIFQDQRYARAVEMLLKSARSGARAPNPLDGHPLDNPNSGSVGYFRVEPEAGDQGQIDAMLRGTAQSAAAFAAVAREAGRLRPGIPECNHWFFDQNLRNPALVMERLNIMLHETASAYAQPADKKEKIRAHLSAARDALSDARKILCSTDTGVFARWHENDEKFKIGKLLKALDDAIKQQTK